MNTSIQVLEEDIKDQIRTLEQDEREIATYKKYYEEDQVKLYKMYEELAELKAKQ